MADRLVYFLGALWLTLALLVCSLVLGLGLGLLLASARLSRHTPLRLAATAYIEVLRGIPLLVTLLLMAFALPGLLREYGQIPTFWLAVFAFGLCYGTYMAETFRAGIESVDVGQREAARALGLSGRQTLWHIVLPQALRNVLPAFVNESVALLKDTSLAAVIGIEEITQRARLEVAATYDTFAVYIMVALIYLVLTLSLSQLARMLERRQARARPDHPSPRAA